MHEKDKEASRHRHEMDTFSEMTRNSTQSYSDLAGGYDSVRFSGASGRFLFDRDRSIVRKLLETAHARRLVDIPVGTGRVLRYVRGLDVDVVGVDCTQEMLEQAKDVADPYRHLLIKGNAASLPFNDGEFDCLTSLRFFHLFKREERLAFAAEYLRVVRPGGYLIVSFTNGWYAGGLNWAKKLCGCQTVEFEYFGEIKKLFPHCVVHKRVGNFLPKQWMFDHIPLFGPGLRVLTTTFPLNRVCWEKFYLLQKK